jgi:hypothetical protein
MAEIIIDALKKGSKVVFCVPLKALVDQTVKEFQEAGIKDIGVIQAQHAMTDWMAPVQVASIQTLIRRPIPEADLIIWDECHVRSKGLSRILNSERWKDKVVIGLSATPWAKGMGLKWQELVVCGTTKELIESGVLCHYRIMVPPDEFKPNRAGVKIKDGEFVDEAAIAEFSKPAIVGNVVDTWMEHGPGYETFLFGQNCAHARSLQAEFNERGISCGYIDGESEEADILAMWKKYDSHEYKVIASVGCLVAGVDKRVRCIILAMMTKSRMKYMQIVGRSFRTNGDPSKVACIARDSMVLTQHGLIPIQDITLDHMVWDGIEFVHHGGAVCKGIKEVIEHDGIIGTPDHEVMTDDGFQTLANAKCGHKRIVTTGIGGTPIWFIGDNLTGNQWTRGIQPAGEGKVPTLRWNTHGTFLQHQEASEYSSLPALQRKKTNYCTEMAIPEMSRSTGSVLQSKQFGISQLWEKRNTVSVSKPQRCCYVDCGESWDKRSIFSTRQDQQRRELRTREYSLGDLRFAMQQYSEVRRYTSNKNNSIPSESSRSSLRGHDPMYFYWLGSNRSSDSQPMEQTPRIKKEVWDIVNAGNLQRFTVNGKLVHNCILDHGGNTLALGEPVDIQYDHLDMSKPGDKGSAFKDEKEPPKPRECPHCHHLIKRSSKTCQFCGQIMLKLKDNDIVHEDGELVEFGSGKKAKKIEYSHEEKQRWYSGFLSIAAEHGNNHGLAAHRYQEKFGVWPRGLDAVPASPSVEMRSYDKHCRIRYIKGKKANAPKPAAEPEYKAEF